MKKTTTDSSKVSKFGDEQEGINFHSSPNFFKMKKFFKNRMPTQVDEPAPTPVAASVSHTNNAAKELETSANPDAPQQPPEQPPLPLDPPPCQAITSQASPSQPASVSMEIFHPVQIKQEIDVADIKQEVIETEEEHQKAPAPQWKMCRDFARGKCNRGKKCIFRHEIDINQLEGVYEFCKDYQNKGCKYPVCKYVHATVREEGIYRNTGVMPPSVKARESEKAKSESKTAPTTATVTFRQEFLMPPPPPPPPPPQQPRTTAPALPQSNFGVGAVNAAAQQSATNFNMFIYPPPPPNPQLGVLPGPTAGLLPEDASRKRAWNELTDYSSALAGAEKRSNKHKCRHCGLLEDSIFGLNCQCDSKTKSIEDYSARILLQEKKYHRMLNCLLALLQTSQDSVADSGNLNPFTQLLRSNYAAPTESQALTGEHFRLFLARSLARLSD